MDKPNLNEPSLPDRSSPEQGDQHPAPLQARTPDPATPDPATPDPATPDRGAAGGNNRKLLVVTLIGVAAIVGTLMATLPAKTERELTTRQDFHTQGRPTLGDPERGAEVILFADYSCPGCRQFEEQQIQNIKRTLIDSGQAHLVFLQSPFLGKSSDRAAVAAECVFRTAGDDTFWKYTKALYDVQGPEPTDWATPTLLKQTAANLHVDQNAFQKCLGSPAAKEAVASDLAQHQTAGMRGTPTVFVNGYRTAPGGLDIQKAIVLHTR